MVAAALVTGGIALREERADACGWSGPIVEDVTTFDPQVIEDPSLAALSFDPFVEGFESCDACARDAMIAEWAAYLPAVVTDWAKVLLQASPADLAAIEARLAGTSTTAPSGYERSPMWKLAAGPRKQVLGAVKLVALARSVEPFASPGESGATASSPPAALLATARAGFRSARDPFLTQRYGFQTLRILFYQRDWAKAVDFARKNAAVLSKPSKDLAWRARYYVAGALRNQGARAEANLELSRIHAGWPALAASTANDFRPMEDADWREALRLAKNVREKTQLWRLVGVKQDGLVALQEIMKLDPTSALTALLVVRELNRAESRGGNGWEGPPEPAALAAQQKAYGALEQVVVTLASTPKADRVWLMQLVGGHLAARRGDVATARTRLQAAVNARPGDARVASQAKASLALALARDWKLDPTREEEVARAMLELDPSFGRHGSVTLEVRSTLALAYAKAGRLVDAEFLMPGAADAATGSGAKSKWTDVTFLREMIARAGKNTTAFDRFVLANSHTQAGLEQELALRHLVAGDFAVSAKLFSTTRATSSALRTNPFVTHIVDCHDCDHAKYSSSKWTHANLAARLDELQKRAAGKGEPAAEAALGLGTALYNLTWYGNARVVLESSHQSEFDTRAAERWYKRAYQLSSNRELKAKAAFYAAKAEMGRLITAQGLSRYDYADQLPVPETWYPIVKSFADTRYYHEILKECGTYRRWAKR